MNVRIATDKDYDQIRKIWTYCFNEGEEVENCYCDIKYRAKNTVVAELDGDVVASIHLNQHTIKLGNKEENVSYVVGVSTLPEARGKGMMKSMMNLSFEEMYNRNQNVSILMPDVVASIHLNQHTIKLGNKEENVSYVVGVSTLPEARGKGMMKSMMNLSFEEMYNRNQNVSILMPIDFRLYRRFGFENCYDMIEHRINIEDLSAFRIERDFKRAKESDIDTLIDIYNKSNKRLNGYTVRGKQRYENMFKEVAADGGHIYICSDDKGVYDGYVIYAINEGKFFVREVYFSNTRALKSILAFIYNHNTQCEKVVIMEDVRNTIGNTLKNPKTSESLLNPFMMGRVINTNGCFKNIADYFEIDYNYSEKLDNVDENVVIAIKDDYINQIRKIFVKKRNHINEYD